MNRYLSSVGFSYIRDQKQLKELLGSITASPDREMILPGKNDGEYSRLCIRETGSDTGIGVYGTVDSSGAFETEYYYPYIDSHVCSTLAECDIEKQTEKDAWSGVCDDYHLGMNLIFSLLNFMEYRRRESLTGMTPGVNGVCLSGLAVNGKVLLPVHKTEDQIRIQEKEELRSEKLMRAAMNGDQDAMDELTYDDMNTYSSVSRRIEKNDIYSVIETFILPGGVECDQYTVMGYISSVSENTNPLTGEKINILEVVSNQIPMRLAISSEELLGTPKVGCRFKADIWLQGRAILDMPSGGMSMTG